MKSSLPWLVAVSVVAVAAFMLGRLWTGTDSPADPPPAKDTPIPPGQTASFSPAQPARAPDVVRDRDLVRQTLRPGKTYQTLLKGEVTTVGTDRQWGIETVVNIHYLFEAAIDRDVIENDGEIVVEHRRFKDIRSVKIDTSLKDLRLNLGPAKLPLLATLAAVWPGPGTKAALAINKLDGLSAKPATDLLAALGVDVLKLTGHKDAIHKTFSQFDSLSGKAIKQVYWNKEDRTGVIQVTPLVGVMTEQEQFLHRNSAVLSDVLIFPKRTAVSGETWTVRGNAFSNLIDPGLRAAVGGDVRMRRVGDRKQDGQDVVVLSADDGRLTLDSDDKSEGRIGWFEPRGEMLFSPKDQVIVQAELQGRGLLDRVSRSHLLFRTEMKQEPRVRLTYSCRVIDSPPRGPK